MHTQASSSPFAMGSKKLGMWLFVLSDAISFGTLLIVYGYLRLASGTWPAPFAFFPSVVFSSVMTLVLLTSSLTMVLGVRAMSAGDRKATRADACTAFSFGPISRPP